MSDIQELVSRVFMMRSAAHLRHWATGSYAEHMALSSFYEDIISQLDEVTEECLGAHGNYFEQPEVKEMIAADAEWIGSNRDLIAKGNQAIAARIDDLVSIYLKTFYKLDNLS